MEPFLSLKENRVSIWGGGKTCLTVLNWLRLHGAVICNIVDTNFKNMPGCIDNIPIVSPDQFFNESYDNSVVISAEKYANEIIYVLKQNGICNYYLFSEIDFYGRDNSINRDRWVKDKLSQIENGKRILDAGAGELRYKPYCRHLEYISQDFCQYDGTGQGGLQTGTWNTANIDIVSDIVDIPVLDKSFDAILCTEVLEHVKAPILAIKEFSRILKKEGILILTAPFCSLTHFAPYHFSTGFNIFWYREVLRDNGFTIVEEKCNGDYYTYLAQELRRLESVSKKYSDYDFCEEDNSTISQLLFLLEKIGKTENSSSELLCYGWQILAKKND